jgi:hypothetical protein
MRMLAIHIHRGDLKKLYNGKNKIPMQIFHDAYFDFKGEIFFFLLRNEVIEEVTCQRRCSGDFGTASRLGEIHVHPGAVQICLHGLHP